MNSGVTIYLDVKDARALLGHLRFLEELGDDVPNNKNLSELIATINTEVANNYPTEEI